MPRTSRATQDLLRGANHLKSAAWKFRAGDTSAPAADEARRRMREDEERKMAGRQTREEKEREERREREKTARRIESIIQQSKKAAERRERILSGFKKRKGVELAEVSDEGKEDIPRRRDIYGDDSYARKGQEREYKGAQAWNLRSRDARRVRRNKRSINLDLQDDSYAKKIREGSEDLEIEEFKPNLEEEKSKMSYADLLQAGWLELDVLAISRLLDRFDLEEAPHLEAHGHDIKEVWADLKKKIPVALECVNDRTNPEFGPAIAQLIKMVGNFLERNAEELANFDSSFKQQNTLEIVLRDFVEALIFRIAYFAELDAKADVWEKKQSFRNALDKLGDVEIPEYFKHLYGRSTRLTAQIDLLSHQIRELAFTLYDRPKNDIKEAHRVKSLEQKVVNAGIRQLEVSDLFPLYEGGIDISRIPDAQRYTQQVERRLKNWQSPDRSQFMNDWGLMTQENADRFNVLLKNILNKFLLFYRQFAKEMKMINERFVSPDQELKKTLQYIFHYHYLTYAPGATDSSSSQIISHFEDSISKLAEGMFTTPLQDIDWKMSSLRRHEKEVSGDEKAQIQKEMGELEVFRKEAKKFQTYLYEMSSHARSFTEKARAA